MRAVVKVITLDELSAHLSATVSVMVMVTLMALELVSQLAKMTA